MDLNGTTTVITGAAGGLGSAIARRFAAEGARLVLCDLDIDAVDRVRDEVGGLAVQADVTVEADIQRVIREAEERFGQVDLFCSNAGGGIARSLDASDEQWVDELKLNVLSHVYAIRALLPSMLDRGAGYFVHVVSSVALAIQPESIGYSATKRAALAVDEWLALNFGHRGIGVSAFCPQGMLTPMLRRGAESGSITARIALKEARSADDAADALTQGVRDERFLILLQQRPLDELRHKATDYDDWIATRRAEFLAEAELARRESEDSAPT